MKEIITIPLLSSHLFKEITVIVVSGLKTFIATLCKSSCCLIQHFHILPYLLAGLIVCISCKPDKACSQNTFLDDDCCPFADTGAPLIPAPDIKLVNIFIETSGSMSGYMPDGEITAFKRTIRDIISRINERFTNINSYSIYNSKTSFKRLDITTLENNIHKGKFSWSGSTDLPVMLDSIKVYNDDSVVNILITDLIFSPENKHEGNIAYTTTDIRKTYQAFSNKFSVSIFCLSSEFKSKNIYSAQSPYYVILQGSPRNVQYVGSLIRKALEELKETYHEVNYGFTYNKPYYSTLSLTGTTGDFVAGRCTSYNNAFISLQDIDLKEHGTDYLQFWIGLDLKEYPSYVSDSTYMKDNINVTLKGGNAKILSVKDKLPVEINGEDDKTIASNCNQFIQIGISDLKNKSSILTISLKYSKPAWIDHLSESANENNREKTYGLGKINEGLEQAYSSKEAYFFKDLPISLIKK